MTLMYYRPMPARHPTRTVFPVALSRVCVVLAGTNHESGGNLKVFKTSERARARFRDRARKISQDPKLMKEKREKIREYQRSEAGKAARKRYAQSVLGKKLEFRARLKALYGISEQEYIALFNSQGGVCAICRRVNKNGRILSVDHHHASGKIRGLLCQKCNSGIGLFDENAEILNSGILYLRQHA